MADCGDPAGDVDSGGRRVLEDAMVVFGGRSREEATSDQGLNL